MRDSFGRHIHYLRVSLTEECNLRCVYCRPASAPSPDQPSEPIGLDEMLRLCGAFGALGFDRLRLTGGEPLLRPGVSGFVRRLKETAPGVEVGLTTNGILFAREARALKEAGLDGVNFSLDSLDPSVFRRLTGKDLLAEALEGISAALSLGFAHVKVNVVVVRGVNHGEIVRVVEQFCDSPVYIRFIEYMPYGYNGWSPEKVYPHEAIFEDLTARFRLEPCGKEGAGPSRDFAVVGAECRVGLISPITRSFCTDCNRLRLTSSGTIRPCLFSADSVDLAALLRSGGSDGDLRDAIVRAVWRKPESHGLSLESHAPACLGQAMNRVGG